MSWEMVLSLRENQINPITRLRNALKHTPLQASEPILDRRRHVPTCDHGDAHVRAQAVPPASGAHPQPLGVIIGRALGGGQESSAHLHTS